MTKVFVDYRISEEETKCLQENDVEVIICPPCLALYPAINGHPDILMHFLNKKTIVINKTMNPSFITFLETLNFNIILSEKSLEGKYPNNIYLNAVSTADLFMHNITYTDSNLLNYNRHKKIINVKQGYTKCSTAIVSDCAFITSDIGINKGLKNLGYDVLFLPPGDILLPGLDYGFIGGCCGLISKNKLAFYGSLDFYEHEVELKKFLKKYDVEAISLYQGKLVDRGSILSSLSF